VFLFSPGKVLKAFMGFFGIISGQNYKLKVARSVTTAIIMSQKRAIVTSLTFLKSTQSVVTIEIMVNRVYTTNLSHQSPIA